MPPHFGVVTLKEDPPTLDAEGHASKATNEGLSEADEWSIHGGERSANAFEGGHSIVVGHTPQAHGRITPAAPLSHPLQIR